MRGFECHVHRLRGGRLVKAGHYACWSMCNHAGYFPGTGELGQDIYISRYRYRETQAGRRLLLSLINEITPCEQVVRTGRARFWYIKFRLMRTYDQSLVLLNFIRNLWHEPAGCRGYTKRFFDLLGRSHEQYADPLQRLMWANREAVPKKLTYGPGHSPVHAKNQLKIKTVDDLIHRCTTATAFLTR